MPSESSIGMIVGIIATILISITIISIIIGFSLWKIKKLQKDATDPSLKEGQSSSSTAQSPSNTTQSSSNTTQSPSNANASRKPVNAQASIKPAYNKSLPTHTPIKSVGSPAPKDPILPVKPISNTPFASPEASSASNNESLLLSQSEESENSDPLKPAPSTKPKDVDTPSVVTTTPSVDSITPSSSAAECTTYYNNTYAVEVSNSLLCDSNKSKVLEEYHTLQDAIWKYNIHVSSTHVFTRHTSLHANCEKVRLLLFEKVKSACKKLQDTLQIHQDTMVCVRAGIKALNSNQSYKTGAIKPPLQLHDEQDARNILNKTIGLLSHTRNISKNITALENEKTISHITQAHVDTSYLYVKNVSRTPYEQQKSFLSTAKTRVTQEYTAHRSREKQNPQLTALDKNAAYPLCQNLYQQCITLSDKILCTLHDINFSFQRQNALDPNHEYLTHPTDECEKLIQSLILPLTKYISTLVNFTTHTEHLLLGDDIDRAEKASLQHMQRLTHEILQMIVPKTITQDSPATSKLIHCMLAAILKVPENQDITCFTRQKESVYCTQIKDTVSMFIYNNHDVVYLQKLPHDSLGYDNGKKCIFHSMNAAYNTIERIFSMSFTDLQSDNNVSPEISDNGTDLSELSITHPIVGGVDSNVTSDEISDTKTAGLMGNSDRASTTTAGYSSGGRSSITTSGYRDSGGSDRASTTTSGYSSGGKSSTTTSGYRDSGGSDRASTTTSGYRDSGGSDRASTTTSGYRDSGGSDSTTTSGYRDSGGSDRALGYSSGQSRTATTGYRDSSGGKMARGDSSRTATTGYRDSGGSDRASTTTSGYRDSGGSDRASTTTSGYRDSSGGDRVSTATTTTRSMGDSKLSYQDS